MLTFKQVKENIANKFLNEIIYMSKEINDDIIIEIVKNDINDSISKDREPTFWDFDGLTENDTLLKYIYDFETVYNTMFKGLFTKYNDYVFDNPQDFVYKIIKDYLNDVLKNYSENVKLYFKILDNIYKKNKDLSIFKTIPKKHGNICHSIDVINEYIGDFIALYKYGFLKCDYNFESSKAWPVVKLK